MLDNIFLKCFGATCKFSVIQNEGLATVFRDHRPCGNRVGVRGNVTSPKRAGPASSQQDVTFKLSLLFYCVLFSLTVEVFTRSQARAQLTARSSSQSERNVHDLLNIICDAVVFLDAALTVAVPSPKLDGLLLRRTDPRELCGTPFAKYMDDSDVHRFQKLTQVENGGGQSLHVDMRDQGGARLPVQLFHLAFDDLFEQKHHIVGVREEVDSQRELPLGDTSAPLMSTRLRAVASGSSCSSGEPVSIKPCDEEHIAVWVDAVKEGLPVVGCTAGFMGLGCTVEQGESFLAWVTGDRAAFLLWLQVTLHDEKKNDSIKVDLLPSRSHITIRTSCRVCVDDDDDDEDDDRDDHDHSSEPRCVARIELIDIRLVRRRVRERPPEMRLPPRGSATPRIKKVRL